MGCNYFLKRDPCPRCGKGETIHIGKSSAGWVFNLRVYLGETPPVKSLVDWTAMFNDPRNKIVDEYGNELTTDEMLRNITDRQGCTDPNYKIDDPDCEFGPNNLLRLKQTSKNPRVYGHGEHGGTWTYHADDNHFTEDSW